MIWVLIVSIMLLTIIGLCWRQWQTTLWAAWLCVGLLPLGLYAVQGSPDVRSVLAGHEDAATQHRIAALTVAVQQNPENMALWAELAARHAAARRWQKAEAAFRGALLLAPDAAPQRAVALKAALGEVLVNAAGGMVPAEAEALFQDVLAAAPDDLAALYYLGLAAVQRQDRAAALTYWDTLARRAPRDAPWYGDFVMNYGALAGNGKK
jgi:cytochrome c-type biogenesis protein CcmH